MSCFSGRRAVVQVLAVAAAALTFAYVGRFWLGLFTGATRIAPQRVSPLLVAPVGLLAVVAVLGGIVVAPFAHLAGDAATVTNAGAVHLHPAYHLDARAENVMALAAWAAGFAMLLFPRVRERVAFVVGRAGDRVGPRHWHGLCCCGSIRF